MNPRQQAFATQYLIDQNATQAAIRAGYSKKAAKQTGHRLLTNNDIAAFIKSQQKEVAEQVELTQQYVLDGLMGIANNEDSAVSSRVRSFELLGKQLGMFTDRIELSEIPSAALVEEWIEALEHDIAG